MPYNMVNFCPLAPTIRWQVWATPANFNGFRVLALGSVSARYSSSGRQPKLCGVEQRAPPIFGRAAITLGIGPHSIIIIYFVLNSIPNAA